MRAVCWGQVTAGWVTGRGQQPLPLGWPPSVQLEACLGPWPAPVFFLILTPCRQPRFSLLLTLLPSSYSPAVFILGAALCRRGAASLPAFPKGGLSAA